MPDQPGNGSMPMGTVTGDIDLEGEKDFDPTEEIGRTGLVQFGGRIEEEFLLALKGDKAIKTYREMQDNDAIVGAVLLGIDLLMRQVKWRVDPFDESPAAVDNANFVWECFNDMSASFEDTLSSILSFLPFGFSFHELVYKVRRGESEFGDPKFRSKFDDGRIGWRKIDIRAQESLWRWDFDESGGLQGFYQFIPTLGAQVLIPIGKALLFRTWARKGSPEGRSVLRTAYRSWFFKKRMEEIEGIGVERDASGLPVVWVPEPMLSKNATANEQAAVQQYKQLAREIKHDEQEGIVMPLAYDSNGNKKYDLSLLASPGRRQFVTGDIISRYDQRIAMSMLADFILLGHEQVGSKALSVSKIDLFSIALGAWLDGIASVFNQYGIPRLLELNGLPLELAPSLAHEDIAKVDLATLGDFIQKLSQAGMPLFPDNTLENFIREQAALPPVDGGSEEF